MTFSARGVGVGASSRGGLYSLKRNMPYALVELGPVQAPLKVIRKSCTQSSQSKNSAEANFKKVMPWYVTCWELSSSPIQSNKHFYDDLHKINYSLSLLYRTPRNGSDLSLPQIAELLPLTPSFLPLQSSKRRGCASAAAPLGPRPHKGRKRQPQRFAL